MTEYPNVTVIICTYNREKQLDKLLSSLVMQTYPSEAWDILVVDNASTDGTASCVRRWSQRGASPVVTYTFEPQQGVAYARNRGFRETRGSHIAYIDDDELPKDVNWLKDLMEPIVSNGADVVSGSIELQFLAPRPFWFTRRFYGWLGSFVPDGREPFQTRKTLQCGGNLAITKSAMMEMDGFNLRFGRKGNQLTAGEDTDLFRRLLAADKIIFIAPKATVFHLIGPARLRIRYFMRLQQGIIRAKIGDKGDLGLVPQVLFLLKSLIELCLNMFLFVLGCISIRYAIQGFMMVYRSWLKLKTATGLN